MKKILSDNWTWVTLVVFIVSWLVALIPFRKKLSKLQMVSVATLGGYLFGLLNAIYVKLHPVSKFSDTLSDLIDENM